MVGTALMCPSVAGGAPFFGPSTGAEPPLIGRYDPYCKARGVDAGSVWIGRVDFDREARPVGAKRGYFVDGWRGRLSYWAGDEVKVRLEPGYAGAPAPVYWGLWVDVDGNGALGAGERLLSVEGVGVVEGTFVVPKAREPMRLRVVMSTEPVSSPCEEVAAGAVADFLIAGRNDPYCRAEGEPGSVWVEEVELDTYVSRPSGGYVRQSREEVYHLPPEASYRLVPGGSEAGTPMSWLVVLDANVDGEFGEDEVVVRSDGSVGEQTGTFVVPSIGPVTRLRVVASRTPASTVCGEVGDGMVADYWVTTAPEPPQNIVAETPPAKPGGCIGFQVYWTPPPPTKWGTEIVRGKVFRDGILNPNPTSPEAINWTSGLLPETTYVVQVSLVDTRGFESPKSGPAVATTPVCVSQASVGPVRVLALLVSFADAGPPLFTREQIAEILYGEDVSLVTYFREVSFGRADLSGTVWGWYDLPGNAADYCSRFIEGDPLGRGCDPVRLREAALEVAAADGHSEPFDELLLIVNGMGEAFATYHYVYVGATQLLATLEVIVHEMGHAFNPAHMGDWQCPPPHVGPDVYALTEGGCTTFVYGDHDDPMGMSLRHFSAINKLQQGYIESRHLAWAVPPVYATELGAAQEFEVDPLELPGGETYSVMVPVGHDEKPLYAVEYRVPMGIDGMDFTGRPELTTETRAPVHGLLVRLQTLTPDWVDAYRIPMTITESSPFDDPYRRIRIEALELGERARVRVTYYGGESGEACTWDEGCKSGYCVDGYCCESACTGQCEACDVAGHEGECVAVDGAPHGERLSCDADGQKGGRCDGRSRDTCVYPQPEGCGCVGGEGAPAMAILVMASMLARRLRRRSEWG